jgi:tyrosinase
MSISRRHFLMGSASAATGLWTQTGNTQTPPAPKPVLRVSGTSLPASHRVLQSYRRAITAMKALPRGDRRNWVRMATVHLDHCAHRNWYFLPWHRAYLLSFERVCRQMSGDDEFRLPYWDWSQNPQMPVTFTQPTFDGQPNPLYLPFDPEGGVPDDPNTAPYRMRRPNEVLPSAAVRPQVIANMLQEADFELFASSRPPGQTNLSQQWGRAPGSQGALEGLPHNTVHGWINGTMGAFLSPLDPLFWLHHANIDRLWDAWLRPPAFLNPTNALWRNFQFVDHFVNAAGAPWNPLVRDLLDIQALGYRYPKVLPANPLQRGLSSSAVAIEPVLPAVPLAQLAFRSSTLPANAVATTNQPVAVPLQLSGTAEETTARALRIVPTTRGTGAGATTQPGIAGRVIATVETELLEGPSPAVRVFLSCPYLSADTPDSDPHYVATYSFFPSRKHSTATEQPMSSNHTMQPGVRTTIDLTRTLATLREAGRTPEGRLELQVLPVPLQEAAGASASVRVRSVQVAAS